MALPTADLIQDITTRFILTAPAEQLMFTESIMFLVEQAHWYYEDYVRDQSSTLRSLGMKEFATLVFENCPELNQDPDDIEQIMEAFRAFKKNVPVMGGILLDQDMQRVLLVKGWKNSACWGFPRGKIHKNETDAQCAVREVLEETGYDIEDLVQEEEFIELTLDGKRNKLFIVAGLDPNSAQFAPKCKGEIGGYAWHKVADLPATREEGNQTFVSDDGTKHKFFMVWPYLKPLRKWIKRQQRNNPEGMWDMPQMPTPPAQQQQQQGGKKQRNNNQDGLWDMPPVASTPLQQQKQPGGKKQHNSSQDGLWDMPPVAATPLQQQQGGRKQHNNQDGLWDTPPVATTPLQQQKPQSGKKQQRNQQDGLWDMPPVINTQQRSAAPAGSKSPLPQPVQQLTQNERRSGGGGSPKHALHLSFHEAAIAQARQQQLPAVISSTTPAVISSTAQVAAPVTRSPHELGTSVPLARLFGGTVVQNGRVNSSSDLLVESAGNFTFNRQQILHALSSATGQMVVVRHPISGRG